MSCFFSKLFKKSRTYKVYGPQGGLDIKCTLPEGFNTATDRCPMVILMHGFISSKRMPPISFLTGALTKAGYATISFDFNAHGKSEGEFINMTLGSEIQDAKAIYDYVCALPYVSDVAFLGHSQGGVIAGMLAGELEELERKPKCLVQLAPAAVLKDDALAGQCMGKKYDAKNPPEFVNVFFHKLGRKFILEAQNMPIYEQSRKYSGKVCLVHGTNDKIVPLEYSQRYHEAYGDSQLHVIEGESHFMTKCKEQWVDLVVAFLNDNLR